MEIKKKSIQRYMLISEILWGLVIVGCAIGLSGTDGYLKIQLILVGGLLMHNAIIWVPMLSLFKKNKNKYN